MRQLVVATHAALPRSGSNSASSSAGTSGKLLPASNRPRVATAKQSALEDPNLKTGVHLNKVSDQLATYSRYAARIDLEPLYPTSSTTTRKGGSEKTLIKDKSDRATSEQVLDPRTRLIVFKMIGRGLIERVDGCVSTGKEANVYHAVSPEQKHLALKIYKTSILVFKDRDRYVSGEFRFKSGYSRSNPRKMVRLWAEKEMRNLRRMKSAGMRVPEAFEVRENVLVMEFMGEDEWQASPRLKDAELPAERIRDLYIELLVILRTMFARCKLVHADFSEYNILFVFSFSRSFELPPDFDTVDTTTTIFGLSTSHNQLKAITHTPLISSVPTFVMEMISSLDAVSIHSVSLAPSTLSLAIPGSWVVRRRTKTSLQKSKDYYYKLNQSQNSMKMKKK